MDSTIARVGSEALSGLKSDLTNLSKALHKIYELMQADMRQVNVAWQDSKYQEFVDNYQPQIQKCDEIANRYTEWCVKVLDPTIENVIAVETTDVGSGEGSVGGGNSEAAVVGGMAAAGVAGTAGGFAMFNLGSNQGPMSTTKVEGSSMPTPTEEDYYMRFKEEGIYYIDGNGDVKLDRGKYMKAVNNVTGNNPEVGYESMSPGKLGYYQEEGDRIVLNDNLTDKKFVETYAHESQHMDQKEYCEIGENSSDPICVNRKRANYKEPCNDAEKELLGPERCQERFDEYWGQPSEVNARESGLRAGTATDKYSHDFKVEHKLEKPKAYRKK